MGHGMGPGSWVLSGWQVGIRDARATMYEEDRNPEHDCERVTGVVKRCHALSGKRPRSPEPKPEA